MTGVRLKHDLLGELANGKDAGAGTRHHPEVTIVTGTGGGGLLPEMPGSRLQRAAAARYTDSTVNDARAGALHHPQVKIVTGTRGGIPFPEMAGIRLKRDAIVGLGSRNAYARRRQSHRYGDAGAAPNCACHRQAPMP